MDSTTVGVRTQLVPGAKTVFSKRLLYINACNDDELSFSGQFV